jgi:CheY-like chemotaxis protein
VTNLQGDRTDGDTRAARRRILLVNDDDAVRGNINRLLENDGYEVIAAQNGVDALTIFHTSPQPIDLLVTDCDMPAMSGFELAQACLRRNRQVAILYISVSRPDEELRADLSIGRRGFLSSPFSEDDLLAKAGYLLSPGFEDDTILARLKLQLALQPVRAVPMSL